MSDIKEVIEKEIEKLEDCLAPIDEKELPRLEPLEQIISRHKTLKWVLKLLKEVEEVSCPVCQGLKEWLMNKNLKSELLVIEILDEMTELEKER